MKQLPSSKDEFAQEAVSLGLLGPNPSLDKPRAILLSVIQSSKAISRGMNRVSILLVGNTGHGKSSTINHLLNISRDQTDAELAATDSTKSQTSSTTEFIVTADDLELEAEDLQLGIVDTPGFNDTSGNTQDACNLYSIKKFYETHPELSGCFPNLIFFVVQATDTRMDGQNSNLSKSLASLKKLQLVDVLHPNVVVILSFCCSIPHRKVNVWEEKMKQKKSCVQNLVFESFGITAPVVLLENKYGENDHGLEISGDYSCLPNGVLQPKNLFTACDELLRENQDYLGVATLNACFVNPKTKEPTVGHKVQVKLASEGGLGKEENELIDFFQQAAKGVQKDPMIDSVQQYIEKQNLKPEEKEEVRDIVLSLRKMGLNKKEDCASVSEGCVRYFHDRNISLVGAGMLEKEFQITKKAVNLDSGRLVGQGYNILCDRSMPTQIMKFETAPTDLGIVIPTCAKFEKVNETEIFMSQFKDEDSCKKERLAKLGIAFDVLPKLINIETKAGYNKKTHTTKSHGEYSGVYEQRMFELKIGNFKEYVKKGITFTADFEESVKALPESYDRVDPSNREKFIRFFNRFGQFVVTSAYGGGAIEAKFASHERKTSFEDAKNAFVQLFVGADAPNLPNASTSAEASSSNSANSNQLLDHCSLHWLGGDSKLHVRNNVFEEEKMLKWKTSLLLEPTMLTTKICLEPISTVIACVDDKKDDASYEALRDLLGGGFTCSRYINHKEEEWFRKKDKFVEKTRAAFARAKEANTRAKSVISIIESVYFTLYQIYKGFSYLNKFFLLSEALPECETDP